MNVIRRIFDSKGAPVLTAVFVVLFLAESRRALRKRKQSRSNRIVVNSLVAIPSFGLLRFVFLPIMVGLALKSQQLRWGLSYQYTASTFVKGAASFLILDYTNYLWHILNHKVPFLWRFHLVHHLDRDLDITTAFRFHFGELIGSVFYRGAFVFLSGSTPINVLLYEILFEAATQFHHSNLELPIKLERSLNTIIVTPRMHGIHHSQVRNQTDSNYSVVFSFWDRVHATARLNVAQDSIVIGLPTYQNAEDFTPDYLLKLPFTKVKQWNDERSTLDLPKTNLNRNLLSK